MKHLLFRLLSVIVLLTALISIVYKKKAGELQLLNLKKDKIESEDGMQRAWRHEFLMTRDPALNSVPTGRIIKAKRRMDEMDLSIARTSGVNSTSSLTWLERGPNNVGGRTRALLVDRSDGTGNTVFAAGVGGGLWKTTNFKTTSTWSVINDFFSNIAITCIKQSPTNALEMYFGTGEGYNNIDAIDGLGIWKTTDGGSTWTQLSSTTSISYVNDLEFDDNGYIYATTRSTVDVMRGVLRSTDGGANWTQVLTDPIPTAISRGSDLERAANGDMYATLGIFSTGHIFRSAANGTNTGISGSWTDITPASVITNKDERIELAVSPNNSSRIYAMSQDSVTDGIGNLFRSDNSGGSWTTLTNASWCDQGASTNTDFSRGQAWYDLILAVDPNNSSLVFAAGIVAEKTTNAGTSWTQATRWTSGASCTAAPVIHADIHEIQFLNSSELIICTDGGIYYSTDGGATFTTKNGGYNVTQYYGMAVSATSGSNTMIAGAQDNGSHLFGSAGINSVSSVTGGDGGSCFIDKTNSTVWITSNPGGFFNIYRSSGTFLGSAGSGNGRFVSVADYADTLNVLYYGDGDGLYGRLSNVETGSATFGTVNVSAEMGANRQVSCVKVDPADETIIWLGCSDAQDNTGASVTPVLLKVIRANGSTTGPPANRPSATAFAGPALAAGSFISSIDIEPGNSNHMILTVSNYGVTSVWESTNGGTSWTSVEGNLPDMPVRWGIFIPSGYLMRTESVGGVMLATELGVWTTSTLNGSSTVWTANNAGLANVRTDQLVLRASDKLVAAATHGRGVFTTTLLTAPLPVTLLNFTGRLQNKNILLEWSTASEFNSSHFELERSYDGVIFHKIAAIPAAGNSNVIKQYNYTDRESFSELNYYRLKMFDIDAKYKLSGTVLIKNTAVSQNVFITGNPVHNEINMRFAKIPQTKVSVRLLDMNGKLLASKEFEQLTQSSLHPGINMANFSKGIYILQVNADDKKFINRVVKQ
jgi:hypothetical protein